MNPISDVNVNVTNSQLPQNKDIANFGKSCYALADKIDKTKWNKKACLFFTAVSVVVTGITSGLAAPAIALFAYLGLREANKKSKQLTDVAYKIAVIKKIETKLNRKIDELEVELANVQKNGDKDGVGDKIKNTIKQIKNQLTALDQTRNKMTEILWKAADLTLDQSLGSSTGSMISVPLAARGFWKLHADGEAALREDVENHAANRPCSDKFDSLTKLLTSDDVRGYGTAADKSQVEKQRFVLDRIFLTKK